MEKLQNPKKVISLERSKNSSYWMSMRKKRSIHLFNSAADRVPAYKNFLQNHGINASQIKTWKDFQLVPTIDKKNYLGINKLNELVWDGNLGTPLTYTSTSGSTGEPFYFMRGQMLDWQYSVLIEEYLNSGYRDNKGSTLVIICFGMGVWIAGLITYKAFELAATRNNFGVSVLTPGINKKEIFNALINLAPYYDQTVLVGYPPFIRDILDEASTKEVNLKKLNMRLLFAAEAITEKFRDYVVRKAHVDNKYLDTMSIYGSADIGAMAVETTTGILLRSIAESNKAIFNELFHSINKHPTLAQFNPLFINFEEVDGEIVLTGNSALPLIRYKIGDNGGVLSFDQVDNVLKKYNVNIYKEAEKRGIRSYIKELPFVYIYERTNLATSFYGLWIYPEWLRSALLKPAIRDLLTGKFTLITKSDSNENQYLEINLELQKGRSITKEQEKSVLELVLIDLKSNSSEYRELASHLGRRAIPRLQFWPAEDPTHFQPGTKQKWIKTQT